MTRDLEWLAEVSPKLGELRGRPLADWTKTLTSDRKAMAIIIKRACREQTLVMAHMAE